MIRLLNWIGLFLKSSDTNPYDYNPDDYLISTDGDKIKIHRDFLRSIEAEENNRLTLLESKTSQLVSQTGIIFSLLSLFIPVFIDKISDQNILLKISFLIVLVLAFGSYILTIHHAIKNYNIKEYVYSKPSPNNVLKYQNKSVEHFEQIEVQDLLYSINQNLKTNNKKADNLIYSYHSFKVGNILTAILVGLLCTSLLFVKSEPEEMVIRNPIVIQNPTQIPNPIKVQNLDSLTNQIINTIKAENEKYFKLKKTIDSTDRVKKHSH